MIFHIHLEELQLWPIHQLHFSRRIQPPSCRLSGSHVMVLAASLLPFLSSFLPELVLFSFKKVETHTKVLVRFRVLCNQILFRCSIHMLKSLASIQTQGEVAKSLMTVDHKYWSNLLMGTILQCSNISSNGWN